ncbi:uncharacterized protein LOC135829791 [Sycon ciliatum]|uniref:uncharacterized protein LOC135829791 n=1 Tax=Sycon ciliatum TaxID=27933 RepID=UPI0031F6636E
MALLFQCSCSVRGSVGVFLLILVAFVSSGHAQNVRVMLDQADLIGAGTLRATCVDMDGNPTNLPVTWSFADDSAVLPEGTNFSISGQNSETIVLRVARVVMPDDSLVNLRAVIRFRCATQVSTSDDATVTLYNDLCLEEYFYCFRRFNYALGSATCTSGLSTVSVSGTPVTSAQYNCTCLSGNAGAPCRSVRDCVANAASPRDRLLQCTELYPERLTVTPSRVDVFTGASVTFNCTSVLPITSAGVSWTVPPQLPMDSLHFSAQGGNTLTIDPITANVSPDTFVSTTFTVTCSATVLGGMQRANAVLDVRDFCTQPDACQQSTLYPPGSAECVSSPFTAPHCDCVAGAAGQDCRGLENCSNVSTSATFFDCARGIGCTLNNGGNSASQYFNCNSGNAILPSLSMLAVLALSALFM